MIRTGVIVFNIGGYRNKCGYKHEYVCIYMCSLKGLGAAPKLKWTENFAPKNIFYQEETGLLEEMADSTNRARKSRWACVFQKVKKYLNDGNMSKGQRNELEEAPRGKIWGNLSIKINTSTKLQPI